MTDQKLSPEQVEFPEVNGAEIVFGGISKQKEFEKLAQENGFKHTKKNKYSMYAMNLFFNGGKLPPKRADVSDEYYKKGIRYFKCWLGSYNPKHEQKEEVCGFILSLISDLEKKETPLDKLKKKLKGD